MPIPLSRILDLCGSWICCSRFFPGGCPRIGTLDSRRFGSAWVWHGPRFAGHGVTGPRCGASRRWDYASERSAAKSHVRMPLRRHTRLPSIPVDSCRFDLRGARRGPDATSRRVYERGRMYEGLGTGSQSRRWDYASERSAVKSHIRKICDVVGIHLLGEMESHSSNISNLHFSTSIRLNTVLSKNFNCRI